MLCLTVPLIVPSLFSSLSCKIAKNPTLLLVLFQHLSVDFKNTQAFQLRDAFISTAVSTMLSLYRDAKDGKITGMIVENKHINELEI